MLVVPVGVAALVIGLPLAGDLAGPGPTTLAVFGLAVLGWSIGRVGDTVVALGAALVLVLAKVLDPGTLFAALGSDVVWLLVAAFVLASAVAQTGLTARAAAVLVTRAGTVRGLAHRVTLGLVLTAFAVPSTSGRAALGLPVFIALARALAARPAVVRALALLFPTVILLSAVATLVGAGAHLIASQLLIGATGSGIGFGHWLLLGAPLAVVASHLATEIVLLLFTSRAERRRSVSVDLGQIAEHVDTPVEGPLSVGQSRALAVVGTVVVLWCTETVHGFEPALVALVGALAVTAPGVGSVSLESALKTVPWSLLVFMASTAVLGTALVSSGAAAGLLGSALDGASPAWFVVVVIAVSTAAHLLVQSRSARSSVLVPLVLPAAVVVGVDPTAAVFISTAAAGFCHTLPSSAKPVSIFADVQQVPTFGRRALLKLSVVLGPVHVLLIGLFAFFLWPHLGLSLTP